MPGTIRRLFAFVLLYGCTSAPPTVANRPPDPPEPPDLRRDRGPGACINADRSPSTSRAVSTVPAGYGIAVYARVDSARFIVVTPDSNLLVSQPNLGTLTLVRRNPAGDPILTDFATGLDKPVMVFHTIGGTIYLYVAECNQIDRYTHSAGDLTAQGRQVIITGLPDYGHAVKSLALDTNDSLYVSLPSSCNACTADLTGTPVRGLDLPLRRRWVERPALRGRAFATPRGSAALPAWDDDALGGGQ